MADPMTARSDHDDQEAEARRNARRAAQAAWGAADAYNSGRIGEAMELIRRAAIRADLATRRAWPFLDR